MYISLDRQWSHLYKEGYEMELHCSKCIMHPVWCIMLHGGSGWGTTPPVHRPIDQREAGPRTPSDAP